MYYVFQIYVHKVTQIKKKNLKKSAIYLRTILSMINQLKKKIRSRETKPNIREKPEVFPDIQLFK